MKVVILSSKSSQEDLYTYNHDLLEKIKKNYEVSMYDQIESDFSNIPELFDNDEKIVLFNHYAVKGGFEQFSKNIPKFKNIKFLLSPYSAYEGLDLDLLKKLDIKYRNNGGANSKSIAQYMITTAFMLLERFPQLSKLKGMPNGIILGEEIGTKTAGIIGMGNVGEELLATLKKLGLQTVYYNRTEKNVDAKRVSINEVFKQDLVFITIATNPETINLMSRIPEYISKNNYIIDVSAYDKLYDKDKLIEMLKDNKFKGYGFETETKTYLDLELDTNLVITPHMAWCTYDAEKRTVDNYLNRTLTILEGKADSIDFIV